MKGKGLLILLIIVSVTYVSNGARTIYVDDDSPADFDNIQAAIDDANNGDTILIAEGIYTGSGNYNIDFKRKAITVRSTDPNDPSVVTNTIIYPNGTGTSRGFYFHRGEDANSIICGLTITNGYVLSGRGGAGIYCDNSSSPVISNCIISGNSAEMLGGGILCDNNSSPVIVGCTISDNWALDGGGVECSLGARPKFTNCVISNNRALESSGGGGGLECTANSSVELTNCTLVGNIASGFGGAVRCWQDSEVAIKNCILVGNDANEGLQIALDSFISNPSTVSVNYSDIEGGQEGVYACLGTILVWGSGNMDIDPCFASFDLNGDPNIWDFHLQSAYGRWDPNNKIWVTDSNMSPCIDTGDPNLDWSAEPWPNGKRINMGAYGGTNQASMNGNPGDFNIDGEVNFEDFCELAGKWGYEGSFIENLNNNGTVDFADLRIFAENWLWRQE